MLDSVKDLSLLQLEVSEWIPTRGGFELGPCWTQPVAATSVIGPAVLLFDSQTQLYKPSPNTLAFIDNYKEVNINCLSPIVSDKTPGDAGDQTSGTADIIKEDNDTSDAYDSDSDKVECIFDRRQCDTYFEYHVTTKISNIKTWRRLSPASDHVIRYNKLYDEHHDEHKANTNKSSRRFKAPKYKAPIE